MANSSAEQLASLVLQRFGLGARPGERKSVAADPKAWLTAQLSRADALSAIPPDVKTAQENFTVLYAAQTERRKAEERKPPALADAAKPQAIPASPGMDAGGAPAAPPSAAMPAEAAMNPPAAAAGAQRPAAPPPAAEALTFRGEVGARFKQLSESGNGFLERLVMFWSNHFAVSVAKSNLVRVTAAAYEREVIRPHVLGKFADMLLAAEQHPTMLLFLDNAQSIGPNSQAGKRRGRGINENLAREILELHTLGVDGGYSQTDVTSFARVITGWSMAGPQGALGPPGTFVFNANLHEPGSHTVLGKAYAEAGQQQGKEVLNDLAKHPSTAWHIASKLVRHFIADAPPQPAVERVAKAFRDTGGDLASVYRALLETPEALAAPASKLRSPQEFLIAGYRATGRAAEGPQVLLASSMMGQTVWMPPGPNGFADTAAVWGVGENMKARLDIAARMGQAVGNTINPRELADDLYGDALSRETASAVSRAESKQQGLAILLMSPEFQRR